MNNKEKYSYSISKFYVILVIVLLLVLLGYYFAKSYSNQNQFIKEIDFNIYAFFSFIIASISLIFLLKYTNKIVYPVRFFFVIVVIILICYNTILPNSWSDSLGNIKVAKVFDKIGFVDFIKNYHTLGFNYLKRNTDYIEQYNELTKKLNIDFLLHYNRVQASEYDSVKVTRIAKHPPTWFCIMGYWTGIFGDSPNSYRFLAITVTMLLLFSIYILSGLFMDKINIQGRLIITSAFVFLPAILTQSDVPKTDMPLGLVVIWLIYFMKKNTSGKIAFIDIAVGIVLSIAILTKFTSITIVLPVVIYYFVSYKKEALKKLVAAGLSCTVLPLALFLTSGYNIILNVVTGKAEQMVKVSRGVSSSLDYIVSSLFYGQYRIGIPFILLIIFYVLQRKFKMIKAEYIISLLWTLFFFSIFFILWGSNIPRHIVGFIPFIIPIFINSYNDMNKPANFFSIMLLLLLINSILLVFNEFICLNLVQT